MQEGRLRGLLKRDVPRRARHVYSRAAQRDSRHQGDPSGMSRIRPHALLRDTDNPLGTVGHRHNLLDQ